MKVTDFRAGLIAATFGFLWVAWVVFRVYTEIYWKHWRFSH